MRTNQLLFTSLIATLMAFTLASCNSSGDARVASNVEMYENTWNKIINQGMLDEINATNFTEDITMVTDDGKIEGLDDFRNYYATFLTGFSDVDFTIVDVFGQGDKLVKHWRFEGKHTGDFFGIPATGNSVDVEGSTLIVMRDGKIAREQDFMDNMAVMRQLGVVSDPNNVSVIDRIYQAFSTGDMPAVLGAMDTKIIWNEAEGNALADGNPYIGPDAVLSGVFARIGSEHEYFRLKDIKLHEMSGNQVLATLRYDAKRKKGGKRIDAQAAHLWKLENGKVTAFQQYVDTKQLDMAAR